MILRVSISIQTTPPNPLQNIQSSMAHLPAAKSLDAASCGGMAGFPGKWRDLEVLTCGWNGGLTVFSVGKPEGRGKSQTFGTWE